MRMIAVKRVYEEVDTDDGTRVLADRLWPRGVSKDRAKIEVWAKELTPSTELRAWYHNGRDTRFDEFVRRYKSELANKSDEATVLVKTDKKITLVTAVLDLEHSHIPTLKSFLQNIKQEAKL